MVVRPPLLRCLNQIKKSEELKDQSFFSQESPTFFVVISPSFMEEEDDPFSMESR